MAWRRIGPFALLILPLWALAALSPHFAWATDQAERPSLWAVALMVVSACGFLALIAGRSEYGAGPGPSRVRRPDLRVLIALGLALRLPFLLGPPIWEDDHYRYFWDGAQTAAGLDPYSRAPFSVEIALARAGGATLPGIEAKRTAPRRLQALGAAHRQSLARVNHPRLTSLYPPLAQACFALSAWLGPDSLLAWRGLTLLAELAALALLLRFLTLAEAPLAWAALYWWNPLAAKEFANSAHLDALMLPALALALLAAARRRPGTAAGAILAAAGLKLWPITLLGLGLRAGRPLISRRNIVIAAAGLSLFAAMIVALLSGAPGEEPGLLAYAASWTSNSALSRGLAALAGGLAPGDPAPLDAALRAACAVLAIGACVTLALKPFRGPQDVAWRFFLAGFAVYSLSPAQYPWYAMALAPLAAGAGARNFLAVGALVLPLYYAGKAFEARGQAGLAAFMPYIQQIPLLIAVAVDWRNRRISAR